VTTRPLPSRDRLTICFAHAAYQLGQRFKLRGIRHFEVRALADLQARVGEADVFVVSGLWRHQVERAQADRSSFFCSNSVFSISPRA